MRNANTCIGTFGCVLFTLLPGCVGANVQQASSIGNPFATATPSSPKPPPELPPRESARICFSTAETLENAGKDNEAIALYDRARQLDAKLQLQATRRIAVLYDRQGEFNKARDEFALVLKQAPNDTEVLNNIGYSYYAQGLWDEAEKHLRLALSHDAKHARAWINLGMTLAQKEDYDGSLAAFQMAIGPAQARCNLAFILMSQGKREEARQTYRQALALDPGLQLARNALAKLETPSAHADPKTQGAQSVQPLSPAVAAAAATRPARGSACEEPLYIGFPDVGALPSADRGSAVDPAKLP